MASEETDQMGGTKRDIRISSKIFKKILLLSKGSRKQEELVKMNVEYQNERKVKDKFEKFILNFEQNIKI